MDSRPKTIKELAAEFALAISRAEETNPKNYKDASNIFADFLSAYQSVELTAENREEAKKVSELLTQKNIPLLCFVQALTQDDDQKYNTEIKQAAAIKKESFTTKKGKGLALVVPVRYLIDTADERNQWLRQLVSRVTIVGHSGRRPLDAKEIQSMTTKVVNSLKSAEGYPRAERLTFLGCNTVLPVKPLSKKTGVDEKPVSALFSPESAQSSELKASPSSSATLYLFLLKDDANIPLKNEGDYLCGINKDSAKLYVMRDGKPELVKSVDGLDLEVKQIPAKGILQDNRKHINYQNQLLAMHQYIFDKGGQLPKINNQENLYVSSLRKRLDAAGDLSSEEMKKLKAVFPILRSVVIQAVDPKSYNIEQKKERLERTNAGRTAEATFWFDKLNEKRPPDKQIAVKGYTIGVTPRGAIATAPIKDTDSKEFEGISSKSVTLVSHRKPKI